MIHYLPSQITAGKRGGKTSPGARKKAGPRLFFGMPHGKGGKKKKRTSIPPPNDTGRGTGGGREKGMSTLLDDFTGKGEREKKEDPRKKQEKKKEGVGIFSLHEPCGGGAEKGKKGRKRPFIIKGTALPITKT